MEKINLVEILKDCPKGMELDCTMYDNLYFDSLNADYHDTINCYTLIDGIRTSIKFTKHGTFNNHTGAKCVIFPKGKTTWEGFVPPCQFKYPKTYEECCDILNTLKFTTLAYHKNSYNDCDKHYSHILAGLQKLLICRDCYWKIAGEEMGLGKPWKPDWTKEDERKYCIVNTERNIVKWVQKTTNKILAFPTEEMRDAFYENFKELIEECKELL